MTIIKGLSPLNTGAENRKILQDAIDRGGEICFNEAGVYRIAGTVFIGDHTHIKFGPGVYFERESAGMDGNAFINSRALIREYNEDISVEGLHLFVNHVERTPGNPNTIIGLRAHIAFMYVKNLTLRDITVRDLCPMDYAIQISDFENVYVENIRCEGLKDGIHFGPGKNFTLRKGFFKTYDDPIALNASDYVVSNPNLGWIENGLIEDCYDLADDSTCGFFIRILGGAWGNWHEGMKVQHSDAVIHNGLLYRVCMKTDGTEYISHTPPTHKTGEEVVDGINWVRTQNDTPYTAGCRNITVRNCYLQKDREFAFAIYMDRSEYLRSYYPNAEIPLQNGITFENIYVKGKLDGYLWINAPLSDLTMINCDAKGAVTKLEKLDTEGLAYPPIKLKLENSNLNIANIHGTDIEYI